MAPPANNFIFLLLQHKNKQKTWGAYPLKYLMCTFRIAKANPLSKATISMKLFSREVALLCHPLSTSINQNSTKPQDPKKGQFKQPLKVFPSPSQLCYKREDYRVLKHLKNAERVKYNTKEKNIHQTFQEQWKWEKLTGLYKSLKTVKLLWTKNVTC